jgi:hypothetical protein
MYKILNIIKKLPVPCIMQQHFTSVLYPFILSPNILIYRNVNPSSTVYNVLLTFKLCTETLVMYNIYSI